MQIPLKRHPISPALGIEDVYVDLRRTRRGLLDLWYVAQGDLDQINVPPPAGERRRDGLWRSTCFELFLKAGAASAYHELNFSPSGEWAAYSFESYRTGMRSADLSAPPIITRTVAPWGALEAHVTVPLDSFALAGPVSLNLAAIVQGTEGERSFWAFSHPAGEPDFHDPACFALELPSPELP